MNIEQIYFQIFFCLNQVRPELLEKARPRQLQPPPFGGHISHSWRLDKNCHPHCVCHPHHHNDCYCRHCRQDFHRRRPLEDSSHTLLKVDKHPHCGCHQTTIIIITIHPEKQSSSKKWSQSLLSHPDHLDIPPKVDNKLFLSNKGKTWLICSWKSWTWHLICFSTVVAEIVSTTTYLAQNHSF